MLSTSPLFIADARNVGDGIANAASGSQRPQKTDPHGCTRLVDSFETAAEMVMRVINFRAENGPITGA